MMKPKEFLLSEGKIKAITRGRLSLENDQYCRDAAARGVQIVGYTVGKPKADAPKDTPPVVTKAKVQATKEVLDIPDERYSEDAYEAVVGNEVIGFRSVCQTCRNSFGYHFCDSPTVMRDGAVRAVTIRLKAKP